MEKNLLLIDIAETDSTRVVSVATKRIRLENGFEEIDGENFYKKIDSTEYLFDTENTLEQYINDLSQKVEFKIFVWHKEKEELLKRNFPLFENYEINYIQSKIIKVGLTNSFNPVKYTLRVVLDLFDIGYDKNNLGITRYGVDIFSIILQRLIVFLENKDDGTLYCKMPSGIVHKQSCTTLRRTKEKESFSWINYLWEEDVKFCKQCCSFEIKGPFLKGLSNELLSKEGVFLKTINNEDDITSSDSTKTSAVEETLKDISDLIYSKKTEVVHLPDNEKIEIFRVNDSLNDMIQKLVIKQKEEQSNLRKNMLEHQILLLKIGDVGENNVLEELKYGFYPMSIYKDVLIKLGELHCQIDFLVITNKMIYILECKNYNSNVKIDKFGSFHMSDQSKTSRTFSAINQIEKQKAILKRINLSIDSSKIQPIIVYANEATAITIEDETVLRGIKIVNLDQLNNVIREIEDKNKEIYNDDDINTIKQELLNLNNISNIADNDQDYLSEYELRTMLEQNTIEKRMFEKELGKNSLKATVSKKNLRKESNKISYSELDNVMTNYLNRKAQKMKVPVTNIMTNSMKEEILEKLPTTENQLSKLLVRNSVFYYIIASDLLSIINNLKINNVL